MKKTTHILLLILLLVFSGCAGMSKRTKCICTGAATGAAIGAGGGAIIGNQGPHKTDNNKQEGALVGAAVGGVIGGVVGMFVCKAEIDTDGDGVLDPMDKCPNTPQGVEVDANGCPLDSDGDSVPDYKDKCPGTPRGVKVDANGCPKDSDGDGVPDHKDKCPNTPRGTKVDSNGCPLVGEKLFILQGINFEFDSSRITEDSESILDNAVSTLKANPSIKVRIEGHTCSAGPEEYNVGLSRRRADGVKEYLIDKGIAGERLTTTGKGEGTPIAPNDTKQGRIKNRRMEFVVTSK